MPRSVRSGDTGAWDCGMGISLSAWGWVCATLPSTPSQHVGANWSVGLPRQRPPTYTRPAWLAPRLFRLNEDRPDLPASAAPSVSLGGVGVGLRGFFFPSPHSKLPTRETPSGGGWSIDCTTVFSLMAFAVYVRLCFCVGRRTRVALFFSQLSFLDGVSEVPLSSHVASALVRWHHQTPVGVGWGSDSKACWSRKRVLSHPRYRTRGTYRHRVKRSRKPPTLTCLPSLDVPKSRQLVARRPGLARGEWVAAASRVLTG
jgi:hypothetical protein